MSVWVWTPTEYITVTSQWAWSLKSPASRLFVLQFFQAQIKENIKAPHHWPSTQYVEYISYVLFHCAGCSSAISHLAFISSLLQEAIKLIITGGYNILENSTSLKYFYNLLVWFSNSKNENTGATISLKVYLLVFSAQIDKICKLGSSVTIFDA